MEYMLLTIDVYITLALYTCVPVVQSTALVAVAAAGAGRLVEASQAAAAEAPAVQRTSSLSAPILQLSGHKGTVYSNQFSPDGTKLAASCSDGSIYMWSVFGEDGPQNYQSIPVHKLDALQVVWSPDGESLVSAGADCLGVVTDVETATRVKGLRHRSFVNSVAVAKQSQLYVLTGSDDKKACLWDIRQREPATVIPHKFQVTAVALSADANVAYAGGIDEIVRAFDARTGKELFALEGHKNTITGLALNADGTVLASNAMDGVAKCWDVRRFLSAERAAQGRCIADLTG